MRKWLLGSLIASIVIAMSVTAQVPRSPYPGATNTGIAPFTVRATDGSIQAKVESTATAMDYPDFTAGLSGVGASYGVGSNNTNAPVNFAAKGSSPVNIGNGDFVTPIAAYQGTLTTLPTWPTFERFLNTGGIVSLGLNVADGGSFVLRPSPATLSSKNYNGLLAGNRAVDLQLPPTAGFNSSTRIASGANSFAAGVDSTASGTASAAIGSFCFSGGNNSMCFSQTATLTGANSSALGGKQVADLGAQSVFVWGSSQRAAAGDSQYRRMMGRCTSSGAAASTCRLTSDGAAAGATNTFNIGNASSNRMMTLSCNVSAKVIGAAGSQSWYFRGLLQRAANTTTYGGDAAGTSIGTLGTVNTIAIAVSADDTNDGLNITFTDTTGIGGSGFNVVAICDGVEAA